MLPHCRHEVRQIAEHVFQCIHCGTVFPGIHKNDPNLGRILDSLIRNHSFSDMYVGSHGGHSINSVDLGSIPEDLNVIKSTMKELEKTLFIFSEILKDALQT